MYETEPLADWELDLLNNTTTVNIKFVVTPTDDPDVVTVRSGPSYVPNIDRNSIPSDPDQRTPFVEAARAYFDAHPPKPAHPLADAIAKALAWTEPKITGSRGNYQVRVSDVGNHPAEALKYVYEEITNLTPDHLANLTWKVQK